MALSLNSAANFSLLASAAIINTLATTVTNGDIGLAPSSTPLAPGLSITGFPPGTCTGTIHTLPPPADNAPTIAQVDALAAYTAGILLPVDTDLTGTDLGGLILPPAT